MMHPTMPHQPVTHPTGYYAVWCQPSHHHDWVFIMGGFTDPARAETAAQAILIAMRKVAFNCRVAVADDGAALLTRYQYPQNPQAIDPMAMAARR